jgi:hypothetical protein
MNSQYIIYPSLKILTGNKLEKLVICNFKPTVLVERLTFVK